jgi:hypothetical protein
VKQLLECHHSTNPLQLSHNAVKTRVFEKELGHGCRRVPFARATATSPDQPKSPALSSGAHRAQYVIPYGIGGNPFWCRRLRSAMQLFDQIAARVFGPGRLDASPANAHHATMPVGVRTRSSAPEAATSGLASGRRRQHQRTASSSALMSQSAIVRYVPTPQMFSYWQAAACPRAARKSVTYRNPRSPILAALVPSVGTMMLQINGLRAGAHVAHGSLVSSQGKEIRAPQ